MKVLSSCNADDLKKCHFFMSCDNEDGPCQLMDTYKKRRSVISLPFMLRRNTHGSETEDHLESDLKSPLFDQPLSFVYGVEDMLPKSIKDILTILFRDGPFTEGIFRKAANEKARKLLREELNAGEDIALEKKSVYLLAAIFKDFLRNIPHKLLLTELYDDWMTALEKINHQERIEAMKEVASKLPKPNLHLLKHLLSVLYHISKNSEVNKMDSNNLAICFGPTMLTPNWDQSLPLDVQKELTEKVKALVEFLIDNCSGIFGEEIYSLFFINADDSLNVPEMQSPNQPCDSAYDSTDLEGECSFSNLHQIDLSHASRPSSTELCPRQPLKQTFSVSSLACFKKTASKLDRRFSEPNLLPPKSCQEGAVRTQKLTKSEENFTQQKELGLKHKGQRTKTQTVEKSCLSGFYRNRKPPNLTIKATRPPEGPSDSLPNTSSTTSLDSASSASDSSVFTSSPLASPSIFVNRVLARPQSFSSKPSKGSKRAIPELRKHSMSFSMATRKKVLTKNETDGVGGFQKASFKKGSRKERPLSCQIVQATQAIPNPIPPGCQLRSRFISADEVFQFVDQKNPGKPPPYKEATKLSLNNNLRDHPMRFTKLFQDSEPQCARLNKEVTNKVYQNLFNDRLSLINDSQDKMPVVDVVIGIHSRANLPLTPQVYRLRTMSGSYQKNKQEYVTRRCSQTTFDHIQCAKESYV